MFKNGDLIEHQKTISLDGIENPYSTFVAHAEGATKLQIAQAYFSDFVDLLGPVKPEHLLAMAKAEARYLMLVESHFDGGDVSLDELRGFIYGVATCVDFPQSEREWLHDAFEWVRK